jgi:formylmethanofuran dehydrogenase subunit A
MNSEELALNLAQHVHYEELKQPLLQNYKNIQELMRIIQDLKKEVYNKQRDIDVLYFELAEYRSDPETFDRPDPLTITEDEDIL